MLSLDDIGNACSVASLVFSIFSFVYSFYQHKKVSRLPQTDDSPVAEDDGLDC